MRWLLWFLHMIVVMVFSGLMLCRCCFQFSLLGLMHERVEGIVKGVHEVGVMDWRLSACEKGVIGLEIKQDNFVEYVEWISRSGSQQRTRLTLEQETTFCCTCKLWSEALVPVCEDILVSVLVPLLVMVRVMSRVMVRVMSTVMVMGNIRSYSNLEHCADVQVPGEVRSAIPDLIQVICLTIKHIKVSCPTWQCRERSRSGSR